MQLCALMPLESSRTTGWRMGQCLVLGQQVSKHLTAWSLYRGTNEEPTIILDDAGFFKQVVPWRTGTREKGTVLLGFAFSITKVIGYSTTTTALGLLHGTTAETPDAIPAKILRRVGLRPG